ncbi:MAG: amidohydrolase [Chloroflexi bacterium]|nr:amidohydrolase [Chloroflexota bacterium]
MKKIDVHAHYYPDEYLQVLAKIGADSHTVAGAPIIPWQGTQARLDVMKEAQVDVEVLSISTPNVFFDDRQASITLAQICNDSMSEICAEDPDHFLGFISVPLPHVTAAIEELHRALRKPGMVGVTLGTNIAGRPLDAPEFMPFYEELNRLRLPAYIHPMDPVGMPHARDYMMTTNIGFLFETCTAATRLVLGGVLEKYPDFPVILCHLGGAIPFISDRIDHAARRYEETRKNISQPPSAYYKKMYFDTAMTYGPVPFGCTLKYAGEDHIVLGTDYPFTRAEHMRTVPSVENSGISAEAIKKIFETNSSGILKLA